MHHFLEQRETGVDCRGSLGEADGEDRVRQISARADVKFLPIQKRRLAFFRRPKLVANRIENHPENNLALKTERDRNAKVRDAVEKIHRPIERVDNPLVISLLIADDALFAIKGVLWKTPEQHFADQVLRLHIDLELDVVRQRRLHRERLLKVRAEQIARGSGRFGGGGEIMHHALHLTDSAGLPRSFFRKKTA